MNKLLNQKKLSGLGPIGIFAASMIILFIITPSFRSMANFTQILLSASVYMLLAMGMSFAIIIDGIDLSAGSIVGLTGGIACMAMTYLNLPVPVALILGVLVGAVCGLINGLLITKLDLIPFIATLGGQWVYRGALKLLNNGATITLRGTISDEALATLTYIGNGKFLGIPVPVYLVLVMAIALNFVLRHTVFGRSVYAVGSNAETAKMSGINVQKVKLLAQSITGLMAGMAGIVMLCRMVSIQANTGEGYEFEGIFASVVGGVSMAGGEGTIFGAVIGALVVAVLRNGLNLNGINSFWQQVILRVLVLVVVYVDTRKTKKKRSV